MTAVVHELVESWLAQLMICVLLKLTIQLRLNLWTVDPWGGWINAQTCLLSCLVTWLTHDSAIMRSFTVTTKKKKFLVVCINYQRNLCLNCILSCCSQTMIIQILTVVVRDMTSDWRARSVPRLYQMSKNLCLIRVLTYWSRQWLLGFRTVIAWDMNIDRLFRSVSKTISYHA